MSSIKGTKILTVEQADRLRYDLPKSLLQAAGLMKHKKKALQRHLQKIRAEWDR